MPVTTTTVDADALAARLWGLALRVNTVRDQAPATVLHGLTDLELAVRIALRNDLLSDSVRVREDAQADLATLLDAVRDIASSERTPRAAAEAPASEDPAAAHDPPPSD